MSLCNGLFDLVVCSKKLLGLPTAAASGVLLVLCVPVDGDIDGEDVNACADGSGWLFDLRIASILMVAMVVVVMVRLLLLFGRRLRRQGHSDILRLLFFMVTFVVPCCGER